MGRGPAQPQGEDRWQGTVTGDTVIGSPPQGPRCWGPGAPVCCALSSAPAGGAEAQAGAMEPPWHGEGNFPQAPGLSGQWEVQRLHVNWKVPRAGAQLPWNRGCPGPSLRLRDQSAGRQGPLRAHPAEHAAPLGGQSEGGVSHPSLGSAHPLYQHPVAVLTDAHMLDGWK